MSITKCDTIDLVTILPGDERIALVAFDEGAIPDTKSRELALQKKLVTYLRFIVSGQLARSFSQFCDRDLHIIVVCSTPPTEGMMSIEGIRDHAHSETFIPVEVIEEAEFHNRIDKET